MIRITGGEFKGRMLDVPAQGTRPTHSLLRQALFNSVQFRLEDAEILDLYAGSGSLGFESLSRGAARVVFVENSRQAVACIQKNAKTLGVGERIRIVNEKVSKMGPVTGTFDLVFADPPYAEDQERYLLEEWDWPGLMKSGALLLLEWGKQKSKIDALAEKFERGGSQLVKVREKNYGDSILTTYEKSDLPGVL